MLKTYKLFIPNCINYEYPKTFGVYGFWDHSEKKLIYIGKTSTSFQERWAVWRQDGKKEASAAHLLIKYPDRFSIVILKEFNHWNKYTTSECLYWENLLIIEFQPELNQRDLGLEFEKRNKLYREGLSFKDQRKRKIFKFRKSFTIEDFSFLDQIFEVDEKSILSCADVKEIIKSKLLPSVPATKVVKYFNNSSVYIKRKTVNNKTVQCLIGLKVK